MTTIDRGSKALGVGRMGRRLSLSGELGGLMPFPLRVAVVKKIMWGSENGEKYYCVIFFISRTL
jgi:hypothetical protein